MRTHISPHDADGSATPRADPSASIGATHRHLSLVRSEFPPDDCLNIEDISDQAEGGGLQADAPVDAVFTQLRSHLVVAARLGVNPLTVAERAASLLATACNGWRYDRHCTAPDSTQISEPHQRCTLAQYHHDLLLLEHGLLETEPRSC